MCIRDRYDDSVADYARITVIATGLSDNAQASNPFGNKASNSVFEMCIRDSCNIPQIAAYILKKAFWRHALELV